MTNADLPAWAAEVLQCPMTRTALHLDGDRLMTADGIVRAGIVDGVVRVVIAGEDASIGFRRAVGGTHFHERSQVGYAMTTLDTSVHREYLPEFRAGNTDALALLHALVAERPRA